MSLIFTESFDGVANAADLALGKWAVMNHAITATGRNGQGMSGAQLSWYDLPIADRHATVIMGGAIYTPSPIYNTASLMGIWTDLNHSNATNPAVELHMSGTGGAIKVLRTGVDQGSFGALPINAWAYVELKVFIHDTLGTIELKIDQVTVYSAVNVDTKPLAEATGWSVYYGFSAAATVSRWDDIYVCNGAGTKNNNFLGDCKVECLRPNGNGTSSQLLGSDSDRIDNWMHVDEQAVNDADYVGSAVNDEQDTYAYSNLVTPTGRVVGVQTTSRSLKMDTNAKSLAHVARVGAAETVGGDRALTTAHRNYLRLMETDPAAADWTIDNVNAAEFGVRVRP